jgi:Restriction endonuclease
MGAAPQSGVSPLAGAVSFCPKCLRRKLVVEPGEQRCGSCGADWKTEESVTCPHPGCRRKFAFSKQRSCPFCHEKLDDAAPLTPAPPKRSFLDFILPDRRRALDTERARVQAELDALVSSWEHDSALRPAATPAPGTQFESDLNEVRALHGALLERFHEDVDKFLYAAPVRLAKFEGEYSWRFDQRLDKEIDSLLEGMLGGRASNHSLGSIARCNGTVSNRYSREYLAQLIKHRYELRRVAPRPDFQLTLDYARRLEGGEFEEWLVKLIRDGGVPGVYKTQASRDQGADVVVTMGTRKIVIQAKQYRDTIGNKAVQEALGGLAYYKGTEAWVVTTSTFSKDAIDLASRTGVRLVEGTQLLVLPALLLAPPEPKAHSQTTEITNTCESQDASVAHGDDIVADAASTSLPPELHAGSEQALDAGSASSSSESRVPPPGMPVDAATGPKPSLAASSITAEPRPIVTSATAARNLWAAVKMVAPRPWHRLMGLFIVAALVWGTWYGASSAVQRSARRRTRNEIQELLGKYQEAIRGRNAQVVSEFYAPEVERYYLKHNVSRQDVLAEFTRSFKEFTEVEKFSISGIAFADVTGSRATASFDREWSFRGTKSFAGAEREQMIFVRTNGSWRIFSEKELEVYWPRHKAK